MKIISIILSLTLILLLLLTACGSKASDPATAAPSPAAEAVIAEGQLVPNQGLFLGFPASGRVEQVLVQQGSQVSQGQVLVRLGDRKPAEAALAGVLAQSVAAQQAYDLLVRSADLGRAQAWQAYMDAQKVRASAQLAWDRLDQNTIQTDIDNAQADVTSRQTDLENAQTNLDKYSSLPVDNATRKSYEEKMRTAQTIYDTAVQKAEDLTNHRNSLHSALNISIAGEAEAKRSYENTRDGPDIDRLALVQAQLDAAKAQATAAESTLDNYELKAPFAGTVVDLNISVYEMVYPQTWGVALADTSRWYVDTSDLTEMDVVKISVGQTVQVTADARPGVTMTGVVETISGAPMNQGGDVQYTVHIRLNDPVPSLLWGMTMEVTFSP